MLNVLKTAAVAAALVVGTSAAFAGDVSVRAGAGSKVVIQNTEIHNHYGDETDEDDDAGYEEEPEVRPYPVYTPVYVPVPQPVYVPQPLYANACEFGMMARWAVNEGLLVGQTCWVNPYTVGVATLR